MSYELPFWHQQKICKYGYCYLPMTNCKHAATSISPLQVKTSSEINLKPITRRQVKNNQIIQRKAQNQAKMRSRSLRSSANQSTAHLIVMKRSHGERGHSASSDPRNQARQADLRRGVGGLRSRDSRQGLCRLHWACVSLNLESLV